jgi:proteasome beta subunit
METNAQQEGGFFIPGATTIGVVCKDGVILASEKRVSYGYLIVSKGAKKLFRITDHIGAACAGLVSDMQILVREMEVYSNLFSLDSSRPISVRAAAKLMSNLLFSARMAPLITQTIVGGVDEEGPQIFILDPLGSVLPDKYSAVGSGTEIAIGLLEEEYKEDMSIEKAKDLVLRAIKSAISRDVMSGNGIDFMILTKQGISEETIKL